MKQTQPAPGTIRRTANFNWPAEGIKKDYVLVVQLGSVRVGQLISHIYADHICIARLVSRDRSGQIVVHGESGKRHTLKRSEYKMEGAVIEVRPQTIRER
jgi:hypothetical protein